MLIKRPAVSKKKKLLKLRGLALPSRSARHLRLDRLLALELRLELGGPHIHVLQQERLRRALDHVRLGAADGYLARRERVEIALLWLESRARLLVPLLVGHHRPCWCRRLRALPSYEKRRRVLVPGQRQSLPHPPALGYSSVETATWASRGRKVQPCASVGGIPRRQRVIPRGPCAGM